MLPRRREWGRTVIHGRHQHILTTWAGPGQWLQCHLGAIVSLTVCSSLMTAAAAGGRRGRLLHHGGHGQPSLDLHREQLNVWRLRTRLERHNPRAQGQALQGCEAEDTGVGVPMRRRNQDWQARQAEEFAMVAPRTRTYILERTRDFFTGRPDEPCSGVVCLEPTNSGATPLRLATSMAVLRSPGCSGADPPTSSTAGVDPWSPPAMRETCTSGAPAPRISND
jgi:hypothetical protein